MFAVRKVTNANVFEVFTTNAIVFGTIEIRTMRTDVRFANMIAIYSSFFCREAVQVAVLQQHGIATRCDAGSGVG